MRNSVRSCTASVVAVLVAWQGAAFAQTIRAPVAPVQGVELAPQVVQSRIPRPLERSSNALAKLGLRPTDLELGRSVAYSVTHLYDRGGSLTAGGVDITKSTDGHWVIKAFPKPGLRGGGVLWLSFKTERGKRYIVDFAIDSPIPRFRSRDTVHDLIDGHVVVPVSGTGGWQTIHLSPQVKEEWFVLYHVRVTPLTY